MPLKNAKWISPSKNVASPIIKRKFSTDNISSAKLYISGLGYFEVKINNKKVGNEYFQPVVSDYEKRDLTKLVYPLDDILTNRIYYCTYDIGDYLLVGDNIIEIQLGGGFYVQTERIAEGNMTYGERVKCIYAIAIGDTVLLSDGTEEWYDSEIEYSNIYVGETHNTISRKHSGKVMVLPDTKSILSPQIGAPDRLIRKIQPSLLAEVDGKKIYDANENISGIVRVKAKKGYIGKITLKFAEQINDDFSLNFLSSGSDYAMSSGRHQIMCDTFICNGEERYFEPKFVWHAFRYFEIEGEAEEPEISVIHADTPVTAEFDCDCENLNYLYKTYVKTQLNNMHGSFPSDCPHRERLGYTGDGQVCAPAAMLLLDSKEFYKKWIRDIFDSQNIKNGHIQHTAPFYGGGGGPGGWGCAAILVPYYYLRQWGNDGIIDEYYDNMLMWLDYLYSRSENGIVTFEEKGGWCLGDWCTLEECKLPEAFVNTYYLIKCLDIMCEFAELLNKPNDIAVFKENREKSANALILAYFKDGRFCGGVQGSDAYACSIGLIDASVCAEKYNDLGHFDTGFLGTDILCQVLFENGFADTAFKLLNSNELGSFGYMREQGATTLWERWNGEGSHNHPMFGALTKQLFHGILGITQPPKSYGWEKVVLNPQLPEKMNFAKGSIVTPKGRISVELKRQGNVVKVTAEIPTDIKAEHQNFFCKAEQPSPRD